MQKHELTKEYFGEFYEKYFDLVFRTCYTYMKSRSDAEDATEDVFVKALTGHYSFNDEAHEKKWLVAVAVNLCKDRLKSWWRKKTTSVEDDVFELPSSDKRDETLEEVLALPTKYKDVVYLHYYLGYKTDEIADILKKPPSTVRNNLKEARDILKINLEKH